jgi:hypothetical protein
MSDEKSISYKAPAYALIFPRIAEIVRPMGYAAAIHGSMANDMDVVLVPWVEAAEQPEIVIKVVYEMIETCFAERRLPLHGPERKPHGRIAWTIPLLAGCAIDLSIVTPLRLEVPALINRHRVEAYAEGYAEGRKLYGGS